jgi:cardiolipin synthase
MLYLAASNKMFDVTTSESEPIDRLAGLKEVPRPLVGEKDAGVAIGEHVSAGTDDHGWIVPPPVELADGTSIQLYKDGEAWGAAFEAIKTAQSRICLEVYIFASDEIGRAMADLLCQKAKEGVRVYVLYDSFGSWQSDPQMFRQMKHAGVTLREFHPIQPWNCLYGWRPFNRDHRKLLVIDNHIGGLGGINLAKEYAGSWLLGSKGSGEKNADADLWRDNAIGIRGPAVLHLMRAFARSWYYVLHGGRIRRAELIHDIHHGEFGLLASVPSLNSPLQPLLRRLLQDSRKSIELTMAYFAPDDLLIDELCKAARRGVQVRLMLPGRGDVKILVVAARSFYEKLMSFGIEIFERQNVILHAKTIVVDQNTSVVGSSNLDNRSIEYNSELSAIIRSEAFGKQMSGLFDNDVRYSKRIDPQVWRRRPYWDRVGQWAVSRARYLL